MNIYKNIENKTLIISIDDRLDAQSAPQFEMVVASDIKKVDAVIIDVKHLEYISSAGLRVILKIKREKENTSIINASAEVYDIFEMTGFTEMLPVSKKFRELSVEGCEIIGKGFYGTVYRINKDTIVKVYSKDVSLENINRERDLARKAFVLGVPTAIPYDVVKVGDNFGSVFELLDAETLQKKINKEPQNLDKFIADYVDVLKIIHRAQLKPGELNNKKEEVLKWAENVSKMIDKVAGKKLIKLIKGIKDTNGLIHGDYHIKNIMVMNNEPFIIDMDTLSMGNPIFELGFMYSCYQAYQEIDRNNGLEFFGVEQDTLDYIFRKSMELYLDDTSKVESTIKKARIISYTQLMDRFENFKDHPNELELFKKEITELIEEIDDLNI